MIIALEKKITQLESDIAVHTTSLAQRDHEVAQYQDTVRRYATQLEEKDERIESLEGELTELDTLKQVCEKKDNFCLI